MTQYLSQGFEIFNFGILRNAFFFCFEHLSFIKNCPNYFCKREGEDVFIRMKIFPYRIIIEVFDLKNKIVRYLKGC